MSRLVDLRPRGKAVGEEDPAWRVPPLLARYRKIADDYLARLDQTSGESNG